ncbi:DUF748 domain-containing protein [Stenotrophobium rhamnosiphilum]|uniref:DUF748 domain-containing protein n=1 Tax=Stenotrophobium rhamnosiphilum TaxID=2029166 RepID=A0A2T5MI14_9GAMM|nr:DUF748 domain-containing protein [Stenotrophobium rhamnosiphilum]PTU32179.1 hypothetical protein CJD38_05830 [Stenotrophobium rhamnosiphilum]
MDSLISRLKNWFGTGKDWATSPKGRRTGWISVVVIVVFGIGAWLGVPPLIRSVATHQASEWLERPVTLGKISFNPYRLKLNIEQLHIGERGGVQPFVDVGQITVNLSWSSLFRGAAIVDSLTVVRPDIHIARTAEQRFNFTDLIEKANKEPESESPTRFALHNITIVDGNIAFDDQVLHSKHSIEKLQLGIPFIANLPSATKIDVQPLLQMVVDGSPFNLSGKTKPFAETHESIVDIKLDQLDLTRYLAYVPVQLPVKIPQGFLSSNLQVHFVSAQPQVMISLSGDVSIDKLKVLDRKDAPLLDLKHAAAKLADVQPLRNIVHLKNLSFDGLTTYAALNRDGSTNFDALSSPSAKPKATAKAEKKTAPFDLVLESASLDNGVVQFTDRRNAKPIPLTIDAIRFKLQNLHTLGKTAATASLDLRLADGNLAVQSKVVPSAQQATASVTLNQINLAALQPFIQQQLDAVLKSGSLNAKAQLQVDMAASPQKILVQPASASIDNFELRTSKGNETPLRWQHLQIGLDQLDVTNQKATLSEISADGLNLLARREANGSINLNKLLRTQAATKSAAAKPAQKSEKQWQVTISKIALNKAGLRFQDNTTASPVKVDITPLNLTLQNVSSDLAQTAKLSLDGQLPRKGRFQVTGDVAPSPLKADLKIETQQLDVAAFGAYVEKLNATIASAALSTRGRLKLSKNTSDQLQVRFQGNATLGKVRVLDKLTDDDFVNWNSFSATGIKVALDGDKPASFHVDALALSDFFARIIMSSTGKLNLQDIMATDAQAAPTSLTRENVAAPAPAPVAATTPNTTEQTPAANISLGQITLQGGKVLYTDNFIKPNYTATISSIAGKVGAFGTQSTKPADVLLQGQFDHNAPLTISGNINPLAPMAVVDITTKATSVELTDLTSYSTKYAGYPLTKGKLSFDVHYQLDQGKLVADNHIYIDQLTFGDRIDGPDATKLPIQLAVSLLKDSNGVIDLRVPVSGSVTDPDFSLGGVIFRAFINLITKAALSPFSLLSSAFGGGDALSYIVFNPGSATLTPEAETHLTSLAKALTDRPALRLDIIGRTDPELDKPGLREAMVAQRVKRQMIRDVVGKGDSVDTSKLQVPPESYNKYLELAYKAESFTKPKNFIGIAKSLPPAEMKKLILTNMPVTDQDLRGLAEKRAEAVRQQLSSKVDGSRLFVVAPKLDATGIDDKGKTTRVDFSLK